MLKSIVIDPATYEPSIKYLSTRPKFSDRAAYGYLLLEADRGQDGEQVFRELYRLAGSQKELAVAIEGIACSLRAEDGTLSRANAWLSTLQHNNPPASTQQAP